MKWNRAEVVATTVVCAAAVAFATTAFTIYTEPEEETQVVSESVSSTYPRPLDRGNYTVEVTQPPAPVNVTPPVAAPESEPLPPITLEPCAQEDSDNCYWDAARMGNGQGTSFVTIDGVTYYPEGE